MRKSGQFLFRGKPVVKQVIAGFFYRLDPMSLNYESTRTLPPYLNVEEDLNVPPQWFWVFLSNAEVNAVFFFNLLTLRLTHKGFFLLDLVALPMRLVMNLSICFQKIEAHCVSLTKKSVPDCVDANPSGGECPQGHLCLTGKQGELCQ